MIKFKKCAFKFITFFCCNKLKKIHYILNVFNVMPPSQVHKRLHI